MRVAQVLNRSANQVLSKQKQSISTIQPRNRPDKTETKERSETETVLEREREIELKQKDDMNCKNDEERVQRRNPRICCFWSDAK